MVSVSPLATSPPWSPTPRTFTANPPFCPPCSSVPFFSSLLFLSLSFFAVACPPSKGVAAYFGCRTDHPWLAFDDHLMTARYAPGAKHQTGCQMANRGV